MRPRVEVDLRAPGAGRHAQSLQRGGLFVRGEELKIASECEVVILGPEVPVVVPAKVVFADGTGIGVELKDLEPALRAHLVEIAEQAPGEEDTVIEDGEGGGGPVSMSQALAAIRDAIDPPTAAAVPAAIAAEAAVTSDDPLGLDLDEDSDEFTLDEPVAVPVLPGLESGPHAVIGGVIEDAEEARSATDAHQGWPARDPLTDAETVDPDAPLDRDQAARNVYERLRGLTLVQQFKIARAGELHERVALERIYGKTVWEQLLRNPRLTAAEVARIARMGTLPRPQLETIVGNGAWLAVPEVRRALLTNTRLGADMIPRILRHLPKHELKLVPQQLAYPSAVRDAARKLLKASE